MGSVINHVDRLLLWDSGSTDATPAIINELKERYPGKIDFRQFGDTTPETFTKARQEMLNATEADWTLILDADEIWWEESIRTLFSEIYKNGKNLESIVVPTLNMVGDMFHFQEKEAGRYNLAGHTGHYNLRAFSKNIPGLRAEGEHGVFGWVDENGARIENRNPKQIKFLDTPYMHTTFLLRSGSREGDINVSKRSKKFKYELGIPVPSDFYFPEVFFRTRPEIISSVWDTPEFGFKFKAFVETPLKKIYRRTLLKMKKYGY